MTNPSHPCPSCATNLEVLTDRVDQAVGIANHAARIAHQAIGRLARHDPEAARVLTHRLLHGHASAHTPPKRRPPQRPTHSARCRTAILAALTATPEAARTIARRAVVSDETARQHLAQLAANGQAVETRIEAPGRNRYRLLYNLAEDTQ